MQLGPFVLCPPLRSEDKLSSHFLLLHHRCWPSFNSATEAAQRHLSLPPDNSTLRFQPSRHQIVFSGALMLRNARKKSQKAVKTRALFGVLLKSCYVKREKMHAWWTPAESCCAAPRPIRTRGLPAHTCSM